MPWQTRRQGLRHARLIGLNHIVQALLLLLLMLLLLLLSLLLPACFQQAVQRRWRTHATRRNIAAKHIAVKHSSLSTKGCSNTCGQPHWFVSPESSNSMESLEPKSSYRCTSKMCIVACSEKSASRRL